MSPKPLLWILLLILVVPIATAIQFTAPPNTQVTYFSECKNQTTGLFPASTANVTFYYPNTSIFVNNKPMSAYGTGQFNYTFTTPTTEGVYNAIVVCKATASGSLARGGDSFQVKDLGSEVGMTAVATALFTIALCGLIMYGIMKAQPYIKRTSFRYGIFIPLLLVLTVGMYYFYMVVKSTTYGGFTLSMLVIAVTFLGVVTLGLGLYSMALFFVEVVESINKRL